MENIIDILSKYYKMVKNNNIDINELLNLEELSVDEKKIMKIIIDYYKLGKERQYEYRTASP